MARIDEALIHLEKAQHYFNRRKLALVLLALRTIPVWRCGSIVCAIGSCWRGSLPRANDANCPEPVVDRGNAFGKLLLVKMLHAILPGLASQFARHGRVRQQAQNFIS